VEPRDCDGHVIKVPGALHVAVLEISSQGLKSPLSTWDIAPPQLRCTWKSGLFGTGYNVVLPWKVWPSTDKLRVVAQFILTDGRVFEAEKDVKVHLPPEPLRKPVPDGVLPEPKKLDGPPLSKAPAGPVQNTVLKPTLPPAAGVRLARPQPLD
jgi:hypothetical protein